MTYTTTIIHYTETILLLLSSSSSLLLLVIVDDRRVYCPVAEMLASGKEASTAVLDLNDTVAQLPVSD